ncbi:hypothetical protein ACLOJK_038822 [Asimina triloba]
MVGLSGPLMLGAIVPVTELDGWQEASDRGALVPDAAGASGGWMRRRGPFGRVMGGGMRRRTVLAGWPDGRSDGRRAACCRWQDLAVGVALTAGLVEEALV